MNICGCSWFLACAKLEWTSWFHWHHSRVTLLPLNDGKNPYSPLGFLWHHPMGRGEHLSSTAQWMSKLPTWSPLTPVSDPLAKRAGFGGGFLHPLMFLGFWLSSAPGLRYMRHEEHSGNSVLSCSSSSKFPSHLPSSLHFQNLMGILYIISRVVVVLRRKNKKKLSLFNHPRSGSSWKCCFK